MFTVQRISDNRIDLEIKGKIDKPQMAAGLTELFTASEGFVAGKLHYRITDFKWPAVNAVMAEAMRIPQLLELRHRFDRIAIVSDKAWVRRFGEIEGMLIPGVEIKAFPPQDDAAAQAWLAADQV